MFNRIIIQELKQEIIQKYLGCKGSTRSLAKEYNVYYQKKT